MRRFIRWLSAVVLVGGLPVAAAGASAPPLRAAPSATPASRSAGTPLAVVPGSVGGPSAAAVGPATPVSYASPVSPMRVLRGFDPPTTPYGPGHLGVDLALAAGGLVRAAADGLVSFAGPVAGRGVVVVAHADGIRTEYEPLTPTVAAGQAVARGQPLGTLTGQHPSCAPASCVHWGARRGEQYLDPLSLLEPLGPVRLLPWPR